MSEVIMTPEIVLEAANTIRAIEEMRRLKYLIDNTHHSKKWQVSRQEMFSSPLIVIETFTFSKIVEAELMRLEMRLEFLGVKGGA